MVPINITDGVPSEIHVAIGRGRYDMDEDGEPDLYGLAKDVVDSVMASVEASRKIERDKYAEVMADLVMAAALYQSRAAYRDTHADKAIRFAGKYLSRLLTFSAPGDKVETDSSDGTPTGGPAPADRSREIGF